MSRYPEAKASASGARLVVREPFIDETLIHRAETLELDVTFAENIRTEASVSERLAGLPDERHRLILRFEF